MIGFDLALLLCVFTALLFGYSVGLTLGGVSILFALAAIALGAFDSALLLALPARLFGIMTSGVLLAIPPFVLMGVLLERSGVAQAMFSWLAHRLSGSPRGMLMSVTLAGALLAASTGIAGASVVALGLIALPPLLKTGVSATLATGSVAAAGTLGQIIPPSIVLIVLGDQMSVAYQKMQSDAGRFASETVTVQDLFAGALLPGLALVVLYLCYQFFASRGDPAEADASRKDGQFGSGIAGWMALGIPVALILCVLGSILTGIATPTEAACVGVLVAALFGLGRMSVKDYADALGDSVRLVSMIFLIVIGASVFSLVFRGLGGDDTLEQWLTSLPGGTYGAIAVTLALIFLLGFFLEFLEITYAVVPLVAPVLLALPVAGGEMDPVWLGVLFALVLQTSFLTPPLGVSLFYIRSVAPQHVATGQIYRGAVPYVALQICVVCLVLIAPFLATQLPDLLTR